jgi:hypothetical protein
VSRLYLTIVAFFEFEIAAVKSKNYKSPGISDLLLQVLMVLKDNTHIMKYNVNNIYLGDYIADKYLVWSCLKQTMKRGFVENLSMRLTSADLSPRLIWASRVGLMCNSQIKNKVITP